MRDVVVGGSVMDERGVGYCYCGSRCEWRWVGVLVGGRRQASSAQEDGCKRAPLLGEGVPIVCTKALSANRVDIPC